MYSLLRRLLLTLACVHLGCVSETHAVDAGITASPGFRYSKSSSTVSVSQIQAPTIVLTLQQAQRLALTQTSTAFATLLDKAIQAAQLQVAEDEFAPKFALSGQSERKLPSDRLNTTTNANVAAGATLKLPTSTQIETSLTQNYARQLQTGSARSFTKLLQIVQPLIKNAGLTTATLARDTARLNDQIANYQRSQILDGLYLTVTQAYYDALQAHKQAEVAARSLERLQQVRTVNQGLYEAGRIAKLELLQSAADIAQSELSLAQTRNAEKAANSLLLQLLGPAMASQSDANLQLVEDLSLLDPSLPTEEAVITQSQTLRDDLLIARLSVDTARLGLLQAKNEMLPQLDLNAGVQSISSNVETQNLGPDYVVGLKFSIPLDRSTLNLQKTQAKANLRKAELALQDVETQVQSDVKNAIRELEFSVRQYRLAQSTANLHRHKFEAEQIKYRAGRTSAFELSAAQEALNNSELSLVQARFTVERALLALQRATGLVAQTRDVLLNQGRQ